MRSPEKKYGYCHSKQSLYRNIIGFAKSNRKALTRAEAKLWQAIRNRKVDGFKFRRQHIIDQYVADFVCLEARLIIEVDGEIHNLKENPRLDKIRTERLNALGFLVIRFTNEEVLDATTLVVDKIRQHLIARV
jgi:very-short-patch-repair endonuclease